MALGAVDVVVPDAGDDGTLDFGTDGALGAVVLGAVDFGTGVVGAVVFEVVDLGALDFGADVVGAVLMCVTGREYVNATGEDCAFHDVETVTASAPARCAGARKLMTESVCRVKRRIVAPPKCTASTAPRCLPLKVTMPPALGTAVRGTLSVGVAPVIGRTAPRKAPSPASTADSAARWMTEPLSGASMTMP